MWLLFRPAQQCDLKRFDDGEVRIVDAGSFKESTTVAVAIVTVHPNCMGELHWHQNADEWQYYISGTARMTAVGTGARARTMDDLRYLEVSRAPRFEDVSFSEWLSATPAELVTAHLNIDRSVYEQIPREKRTVVRR